MDFFHACEYLSKLAEAIFGGGSERANAWAEKQRHTLRHETSAVAKVITSAAQQKRRQGLQGTKKDCGALPPVIEVLQRSRRWKFL